MGFDPLTLMTVGSLAGSLFQGNQQKQKQEGAQGRAEREAKKTADLTDQANNKANAKKPNLAGLYQDNAMAGKAGIAGTMLTSPTGVDRSSLTLGKTTLLGG